MTAVSWSRATSTHGASDVLDAILDEFDARWDAGQEPRAEEYLGQLEDPVDQTALVFHEWTRRRLDGRGSDLEEFLARFPAQADRLRRIVRLEGAFQPALELHGRWLSDGPFPEPGQRSGPYRLVEVLGTGRFARVYRAWHEELSFRPVVVKLAWRESPEPEWLARLRHPHVVDILAQGLTEDGRFQRIVMPDLGGATLAQVLGRGGRPRDGRDWLARIDRLAGEPLSRTTPWRRVLERLDRTRAAAWIVARLAEGLEAAHRRGVAHGDLKPSNVLLAGDGRPLLFDFNLAGELDALEVERGGTVDYLAPERLRFYVEGVGEAPSRPDPLARRRADLYGLGLMLVEALGGTVARAVPEGGDPASRAAALLAERSTGRALRRWLAEARVPIGLRSVLERCLAPEPEDRYPHAAHLAEDLDAYVEDRPVRHARPRGLWARGAVVVVRRRRLLASVCLALAILGGLMGWVAERIAQERRDRALERLAEYWSGGQPDVFRFQWLGRWQPIEPSDAILRARRVLNSYGVLEPGDWRTRVDVAALPSEVRADLELWLLEHAWRLADGLIRRGGSDDLRDALTILERDGHWSRLAPIRERRRWLRERLGLPPVAEVAQASRPEGVAEAYVWGLEFEPQQARRALSQFVLAGARAGGSFWADYRAAAAAYRVALYREASMRLDRCLARYPRNAALLVQQAACQYRLGRLDEAERACERALAIDPMLAEAYRTRAFVRARLAQRGATATDRERFAAVVGRTGRLASHELEWLTAILEDPNGPWPGNDQDQVARFRSDTVDDAELYVLQGIRLEQSGRLAAAFQAYEAAVSANPEHLYAQAALALARFQWALMLGRALQPAVGPLRQSVPRTNPQPLEMRSEILEPFVRIVEHPRFEELVAQRPEALSLITFSWLECLARGRLDAAVEHLTRGLELVRRHENWDLRNDQLAHLQQSRAWMLYGLAHLEARREVRHPTPDGIDRIARWLQEAQAVLPNRVRRWFEKDRVFDPIRSRITAAEAKRG